MSKHQKYTKREDALIVEYLPRIGYEGLKKMLPHRTHDGLTDRVKTLRSRGVVIGKAYVERLVVAVAKTEPDDAVIRENLDKVGYQGLLQLLPERNYFWIRYRVKKLRSLGLMPKTEKRGRPPMPEKKKQEYRETSTFDCPRSPGLRHHRYMAGESFRGVQA